MQPNNSTILDPMILYQFSMKWLLIHSWFDRLTTSGTGQFLLHSFTAYLHLIGIICSGHGETTLYLILAEIGVIMMPDDELKQISDNLYEKYGKPLETEHYGQYVAISRAGKVVLGPTVLDVMDRARTIMGPGNFIFKVGEKSVGKIR